MCQQSLNSLIALLWVSCLGFADCSIMTYISNTVAGAAAQHLQVFNFHRAMSLLQFQDQIQLYLALCKPNTPYGMTCA